MVTTLNITLDDDVADRARAQKEARGLTWAEVIEDWTEQQTNPTERSRTPSERNDTREASAVERSDVQEPVSPAEVDSGAVEEAIQGIDFGLTRKGTVQDRQHALRAAYDKIKNQGKTRRRHMKEVFETEVGFSSSFDSWYENFLKEYLVRVPGVEYRGGQGSGEWVYVGETDG